MYYSGILGALIGLYVIGLLLIGIGVGWLIFG